MAQEIWYYKGEAEGGATFYMYDKPTTSSAATRVYNGALVTLSADYRNEMVNGMYPTINPGGWMFPCNIAGLSPVYRTVTDPCTPPDSVTLSGETLVISGGAGGDLNDWKGWGVSWRERSLNESDWSEWTEDAITVETEVAVTVTAGKVRQFRVRTIGSAGSDYYSDYVVCEIMLNGNSAAGTPTVVWPVGAAVARCRRPTLRIQCPPDPDGDEIRLMRRIDGGSWMQAAQLPGTGGVILDCMGDLSDGEHMVEYQSVDMNGLGSDIDCARFTVLPQTWTRPIASGDVIANETISHVADIEELLKAVNGVRAFYGLGEVTFRDKPGRFVHWKGQMELLLSGLADVFQLLTTPPPSWPQVESYPSAAVINAIREACES